MDLVERSDTATSRHPWETARARFVLRLLERHGLLDGTAAWLDAGAGDGWFAGRLRQRVPAEAAITCWDVNYTEEDMASLGAEHAGIEFVSDLPARRFGRLLLLDVLEHVEDDFTFLASLVDNVLDDRGYAVISVPAYQSLFSAHDRALVHFRRYAPADCGRLLERSGLEIVSSGGLFASLVPARAAQVLVERVRGEPKGVAGIGRWEGGRLTTWLAQHMLDADAGLAIRASARGRALPGLSYWALCRVRP